MTRTMLGACGCILPVCRERTMRLQGVAPPGPSARGDALDAATGQRSPDARRIARPRWREPRLWIGLLVVAGSVVVGARIGEQSGRPLGVWQLTRDVPAGGAVDASDLRQVWLPSTSSAAVAAYLSVAGAAPSLVAQRPLERGELLPRAAVAGHVAAPMLQVPLSVPIGNAPADLGAGDRVDVWAVPGGAAGPTAPTTVALRGVAVVSVSTPAGGDSLLVLVSVPTGAALAPALTSLADGTVVLVRRG